MDILAALAADPTLLPLWAVMLFAAGMYPIGMIFGCTPCCCSCPSGSTLPETITATLNGFADHSKTYLTSLTFESCYGSGASGRIESPGHVAPDTDPVPDRGPVGSVTLLNGGSGYAKLGRVQPTVTVSSVTGSGTGAEFTVTLSQSKDSCGLDRWAVKSVSQKGGTGYEDGDQLQFTVAEGDTVETAASAVFAPQYGQPTLSLSVAGGSGGSLAIDGYFLRTTGGAAGYYGISSVSVTNGGSGYTDNTQATITLGTGDEGFPSQATPDIRIRTGRQEPGDDWLLFPIGFAAGSGLVVSLTLTNTGDWWEATAASVVSGGTGYTVGESYSVEAVDGETFVPAEIEITSVGAGGVVTGIALTSAGEFDGVDTGVIESVTIGSWQGAYRKLLSAGGINVTNGGSYYREDATATPYVAAVTVGVTQSEPSQGAGAVINATIDDDPASETFGQITGLSVADGGDGYLAWVWETNDCCGHYLNGQSVVLERWSESNAGNSGALCNLEQIEFFKDGQPVYIPVACVYTHRFCGGWSEPFLFGSIENRRPQQRAVQLYVGYTGEGQPAVAKLARACGAVSSDDDGLRACLQDWVADTPTESCGSFAWSATNANGASIDVSSGGEYAPEWRFSGCEATQSASCGSCNVCCQGDGEVPEEIEVVITDEWLVDRPAGLPDFSGTYVAPGVAGYWGFAGGTGAVAFFQVGIHPCHDGARPVYVTPQRDGCETCIKKCEVWFGSVALSWSGGFSTARLAPADPGDDCGACENTPICSPSGKAFSLSADGNSTGYGNGITVATATVQ